MKALALDDTHLLLGWRHFGGDLGDLPIDHQH
jgi:hypothetical protein